MNHLPFWVINNQFTLIAMTIVLALGFGSILTWTQVLLFFLGWSLGFFVSRQTLP